MSEEVVELTELKSYKCERCGFDYQKRSDYAPYLCHRCMRFVAKKTFTIMHQIVPPQSAPVPVGD